jgi:hypothetical protein
MIVLNAPRFRRISRLSTLYALAGFCALSLAVGCNRGSQPTASTAPPAANASTNQNATTPAATTSQPANQQIATQAAPSKPVEKPKKPFSEMTAKEVAQDPAAYGFKKGGEIIDGVMHGNDIYNGDLSMVYGINKQWVRQDPGGKVHVLTIHYDKSGKVLNARWGGF